MLVFISWFTALTPDFQNGDRLPSWIFKFSQFLSKFKTSLISTSSCKIWWRSDDRGRVIDIIYFQNGGRTTSWIFVFSQYLWKIQIWSYFYVSMKNLVKIGRSTAELLRIFDFHNGGRPLSWIWYDVIADHPRFAFDGPNILLKLNVARFYTSQVLVIIIFGPFGLKLPIHAPFGKFIFFIFGVLPYMKSDIVATPKGPSLGENTSYEP